MKGESNILFDDQVLTWWWRADLSGKSAIGKGRTVQGKCRVRKANTGKTRRGANHLNFLVAKTPDELG